MQIIEYSIHWYKGEIFESTIVLVSGICFFILASSFWKWGHTQNASAVVIPFYIISLIFISSMYFSIRSCKEKITELQSMQLNSIQELEFAKSEKARVERFENVYKWTLIGASIAIVLGLSVFILLSNAHSKAIALALIILGISALIIDYFSEERAHRYLTKIVKILEEASI